MTRSVRKSTLSAPDLRGGRPSRWCASNLILVMLTALVAIASVIEFLRG